MSDGESVGEAHKDFSPLLLAITTNSRLTSATNVPSADSHNLTSSIITLSKSTPTTLSTQTFVSSVSSSVHLRCSQEILSQENHLQHQLQTSTTQISLNNQILTIPQKFNTQQLPLPMIITPPTQQEKGATEDICLEKQIKPQTSGCHSSCTPEIPTLAKRQKLELNSENAVDFSTTSILGSLSETNNLEPSTTRQDLTDINKIRLLEHKRLRLKTIRTKHNENVTELFYLQSGGHMMDFLNWHKKPLTSQYNSYTSGYRLEQFINDDNSLIKESKKGNNDNNSEIAAIIGIHDDHQFKAKTHLVSKEIEFVSADEVQVKAQSQTASNNTSISSIYSGTSKTNSTLFRCPDINIPTIGATPVSTKLPAAVSQLSQLGDAPHVPCNTGHGSTVIQLNDLSISQLEQSISGICSAERIIVPSESPESNFFMSGGVSESPAAPFISGNSQEYSFKAAKQEVYVMQRISELQKEGLWAEKRLPKLQEPNRPKAHWDYLLEEMVWLAADFAQERKWKKNAAKKCAKMVQKYFQEKANAVQKAEKAQEAHLKRVAAFISKEVKIFWSNVEKFVEYKHQTKLEEKRKKALDQHLSFIVDQTEKFSQQLAEGMNKSLATDITKSQQSPTEAQLENMSDDDFRPDSASEDDEETIALAEEEFSNINEEIAALEKESQMELDDFINDLPEGYLENRMNLISPETKVDDHRSDTEDTDFKTYEESEDDENTIEEQEEEEVNIDHQKELHELKVDLNLSVNQLIEKYKSDKDNPQNKLTKEINLDEKIDSDDDSNLEFEVSSNEETDNEESEEEYTNADSHNGEELKHLIADIDVNNKDGMIKDAAALAESLQPKGNTLSSTNVVTPIPFLLKHSLREYQHIGLDWLVTMNERKLNGILADEMGLGKTIQTIALLAHLACVKENWGPHLIVVPSSVMLNWEMEFKKWCPGFKILTYYGTQKERKLKRVGWTKPNAFHVCITSYKLVVQDQQSFRRKKWKYLILDEAQNIKNFKSQRWQLLLNFSTERRLLLTGTPLQNDLMELWSLMHFLMPCVFSSHREFKEWFSNPMTGMIEGNVEYNESLINRLHKVLRPFLLRRLKIEVEKQMPKKYEHVIMCRLSKRQRYLYDDFMSRSNTKETLRTGNLLSVINILMQLRKVCNHPNMFEVRPTISPFQMDAIYYEIPRLVYSVFEYNPFLQFNLHSLNLLFIQLEFTLMAYVSHKSRLLSPKRQLMEEVDSLAPLPPSCPTGKYKFHVRVRDQKVYDNLLKYNASSVCVGTSPVMKVEGKKLVPVYNTFLINRRIEERINAIINPVNNNIRSRSRTDALTMKLNKVFPSNNCSHECINEELKCTHSPILCLTASESNISKSSSKAYGLVEILTQQVKKKIVITGNGVKNVDLCENEQINPIFNISNVLERRKEKRQERLKFLASVNQRRCDAVPIYGADCLESLQKCKTATFNIKYSNWQSRGYTNRCIAMERFENWTLNKMLKSYEKQCNELYDLFNLFILYVPAASAPRIQSYVKNFTAPQILYNRKLEETITKEVSTKLKLLHPIMIGMTTQFPDPRLIQYDCGKLQTLDRLLRQLKLEQHRVLIFTQMTKMLDVLESFLNYHGYIYLRLDGSTRVEQRQILMERFNGDKRIFCFILSTRSGGVGINLTGADTVIFYDSDWNPTMDAQAQDRCHRIGQTRDVHIYRLVSEKTIEVNILKKANQKRMLSDVAIEGGNFTTSYFKSSTIKDLFDMEQSETDIDKNIIAPLLCQQDPRCSSVSAVNINITPEFELEKQSLRAFENALAVAEDEQDVQATRTAKAEAAADLAEFDETIPIDDPPNNDCHVELSKADLEVQNLVKQLSPIERYAMRFVEETGVVWSAEQLRAAEEEIEAQKREWEANRLSALLKEEEILKQEGPIVEMITYNRKDANNQVNNYRAFTSRKNRVIKLKRRPNNEKNLSSNTFAIKRKPAQNKYNRLSKTVKKCLVHKNLHLQSGSVSRVSDYDSQKKKVNYSNITLSEIIKKNASKRDEQSNSIKKVSQKSVAVFADIDASRINESVKFVKNKTGVKNQKILNIVANKRRQAQLRIASKSSLASKKRKISTKCSRQLRSYQKDLEKEFSKCKRSVDDCLNDVRKRKIIRKCDENSHKRNMHRLKSIINKKQNADTKEPNGQIKLAVMADVSYLNRNNSYCHNDWKGGTTSTNSIYYKVSDRIDSDDQRIISKLNISPKKNKTSPQFNKISQKNIVDINSPRTRSRGAVEINLWTLDVSPVLPGIKPNISKFNKRDEIIFEGNHTQQQIVASDNSSLEFLTIQKANKNIANSINENNSDDENSEFKKSMLLPSSSTPLRCSSSDCSKIPVRQKGVKLYSNSGAGESKEARTVGALHRWLLKTPRVNLRQTDAADGNKSSKDVSSPKPLFSPNGVL